MKVGVRTQRHEELHALDVQERLLETGGQCISGPRWGQRQKGSTSQQDQTGIRASAQVTHM